MTRTLCSKVIGVVAVSADCNCAASGTLEIPRIIFDRDDLSSTETISYEETF
jgi:hypothetical protein